MLYKLSFNPQYFALEDTKGLRSLLSFIEKKVAKKSTAASKSYGYLPLLVLPFL